MKKFSEKLNKEAERIVMSRSEKNDLKDRLLAYMEYHPLPTALKSEEQKEHTQSFGWVGYISAIPGYQLRSAAMSFALLLAVVVPLAAERTVPGDVLYPVKVRFNEEIRSSLSFSPYDKVEWETKRIERRLAEARLLADEGKLTDEVQADVVSAVKEHSEAVEEGIEELRKNDSDEAAIAEISFAASLEVQSEVLESERVKNDEEGRENTTDLIASAVEEVKDKAVEKEGKPSFDKLLGKVEQESTAAYELFFSIEEFTSDDNKADIEVRLSDAENKITLAIATRNAPVGEIATSTMDTATTTESVGVADTSEEIASAISSEATVAEEVVVEEVEGLSNEEKAIALLREVLVDIKKLISFMTDIEVKENVAIEDLVPKELTDEEALFKGQEWQVTLNEFISTYSEVTEVTEAFLAGKNELVSLKAKLDEAINTNDLVTLRSTIRAINALYENVEALAPEVSGETEAEAEPSEEDPAV
tara:strand:- start:477 stop:1907 length:1431 start_codon:yes stop_codon:yes gene_type:complete